MANFKGFRPYPFAPSFARREHAPVIPENSKNIPSKELWAVTGRWSVTPDSRPAAAVIF